MPSEPTANNTDPAAPAQADPTPGSTTEPSVDPSTAPGKGGNSEAAKYRRQLREAERDRDRLAGVVDTYQRSDVERMLEGKLANPIDFWVDVDLGDLRGDDGSIDPELVDGKVAALLDARPHWAPTTPSVDLGAGQRGVPSPLASTGWAEVLRGGTNG